MLQSLDQAAYVTPGRLEQVLNLDALNISSLALTSLTPKDEINAIHKRIEEDSSLRLLYGVHKHNILTQCMRLGVCVAPHAASRLAVCTQGNAAILRAEQG